MSTTATPGILRRPINPWWFAITGLIALTLGANTLNVLFNVTVGPVTEEFGWNLADFTNGAAIATFAAAGSTILVGLLIVRFGVKLPTVPFLLAFAGAIMLLTTATTVTSWTLLCLLLGVTAGASMPALHATVVTAWFTGRRGIALGVLATGSSIGAIVMPFFANWLAQSFGWRGVYIGVGLLALLIPPAIVLFVTRMPEAWTQQRVARIVEPEARLSALVRTRHFWLLVLGAGLVASAMFGLQSQIFPITTGAHGYSREFAALLLSVYGLSGLVCRLLTGFLIDRVFAPAVGVVIFALGGLGIYLIFTSSIPAVSFVAAILVGGALGAETDIAAYSASRYFPAAAYAKVISFALPLMTAGGALGILLVGQLYVASGGYTLPMIVLLVMVALGILCFAGFGRYRYGLHGEPLAANTEEERMTKEAVGL